MDLTSKRSKKHIYEFERTSSEPNVENNIRENVSLGVDPEAFIIKIIMFIIIFIIVSIGFPNMYPLIEGYKETGEIIFIAISVIPYSVLLFFSCHGIILFIESRMELNKELISAKKIELKKKNIEVRRKKRKSGARTTKYIYLYVLNNGGKDIVIRVKSESNYNEYNEGDMVPVYLITKKWWIFEKNELNAYFKKKDNEGPKVVFY